MSPPRRAARRAAGVAGAAALIAAVTVVARVVGFGRWLVFSRTVTDSCLGTVYSTANMLPNIAFEVVAGGALAGAVVPVVGAHLTRHDPEGLRRTASALLTWVLVALVPLAAAVALLAGPLMRLLLSDLAGCDPSAVDVAQRMFLVFAPQIPLYGLAVVCGGILNAHRRFLAAALSPLVSSAVLIATYLTFGATYDGSRNDIEQVPLRYELLLAIGTTLGVVLLALAVVLPVARLRLGLRPSLRFPPGAAAHARRLALAGLAGVIAQQLFMLAVVVLANGGGGGGALNVFNYAWAVYLLPYAVLVVPIATAAFTALSEHGARRDEAAFAATSARTTRAVLLASLLGAALLAGTAWPIGRMFLGAGTTPPEQLAWAMLAFAPGAVGFSLVAHLGRVLMAHDAGRVAAGAVAAGWIVAGGAAAVLVGLAEAPWTVAALGAANSLGMTVAGGLLLAATARRIGRGALAGLLRTGGAGTAAGVVAAAAGALVTTRLPSSGLLGGGLVAVLGGLVVLAIFAALAAWLDGDDVRALVRRRFARV